MAFHKTEYLENAQIIGLRSYFNDKIEGDFNLDLDNIYLNDIENQNRKNFAYEFRVIFNTGYICNNVHDFFVENNRELLRNLFNVGSFGSIHSKDPVDDIFCIRMRYADLNHLKEYYYSYNDGDIEFLNEFFLRLFQKVVKRCGPRYKEAVLKGATELAYALSHRYRLKQTSPM